MRDNNTTVLTPNRRLSATLHKLYREAREVQGEKCWETPDILPISSWIQRIWQQHVDASLTASPLLLNATQEAFLWENILLHAKTERPLLQITETAKLIKSAWRLLKEWRLDLHHPQFSLTEDYAAFQEWALQFQIICKQKNVIDAASLPDLISGKLNTEKIMLVGFTELSPQWEHLLPHRHCEDCELAKQDEANQKMYPPLDPRFRGDEARISLPDQETEWLTMARWAKSIITENPDASIACVIPSLDKKRDRIKQIFSECFRDCEGLSSQQPFNISAGKSLARYPIIQAALQLLTLHKKTISIDTMNHLLTSPFLGEAEKERIKRAQLDVRLRKKNMMTVELDNELLTKYCPRLAKRIHGFLEQLHTVPQELTYSEWAITFTQLLTTLGWPGERSLNSDEYQIVENWLNLLSEYRSLDHIAQPVSFQIALHQLTKLANSRLFQPKTPDAPIQVLGLLEAAGLPFDYIWMAEMDDLTWPPQPKPNPFIPKSLQRELHMPHATAERELRFCEQLLEQFRQSTKNIIFSHAEKQDDLELKVSPLIRDVPLITIDELTLSPHETLDIAYPLETLHDEMAPAFTAPQKMAGGTTVIKQQAQCPFKAFAEQRLHARELENLSLGLRKTDRGSLIHLVLEKIWKQLNNHQTLISLDQTALSQLIHHCIDDALKTAPLNQKIRKKYLLLEKERLHKIIWNWLQLEKEREPFFVEASEQRIDITLNQLSFTVRVDRIDQLADGKKFILDYKTGKNNKIDDWFSERPEEPQLPLYALIDAEHTAGIAFAQVNEGNFRGLAQHTMNIKGIKQDASWETQLSTWQTVLTQLSDDFYHGIAKTDPKDPKTTCEYCALKPLCRIDHEMLTDEPFIHE